MCSQIEIFIDYFISFTSKCVFFFIIFVQWMNVCMRMCVSVYIIACINTNNAICFPLNCLHFNLFEIHLSSCFFFSVFYFSGCWFGKSLTFIHFLILLLLPLHQQHHYNITKFSISIKWFRFIYVFVLGASNGM